MFEPSRAQGEASATPTRSQANQVARYPQNYQSPKHSFHGGLQQLIPIQWCRKLILNYRWLLFVRRFVNWVNSPLLLSSLTLPTYITAWLPWLPKWEVFGSQCLERNSGLCYHQLVLLYYLSSMPASYVFLEFCFCFFFCTLNFILMRY